MNRYIDADALKASYVVTSTTTNSLCHLYVSIEDINSAPSIDIVRCKECKHYNGSYCFNIEALMPKAPNPNDFCSYGERNEQTKRSEK